MNIKRILDAFKLIGYVLLLIADEVITVRSFYSVGEFFLAGFGGVIVLIGAWVFLDAIRRKGAEKWLKLIAWGGSVLLIVFLNWAFVLSSITVQSADVATDTKAQTFAATTNERQINQALDTIDMYNKKLADLNKWQDKERKDISDRISEQNALIASLTPKKQEVQAVTKEAIKTTEVFKKMSTLFGNNEGLTTSAWWILAFLVAQLFTVLAAPKSEDDMPTRRKRTLRIAKPKDLTQEIWWWVWGHYACVRTNRTPPHKLLPFHEFDVFITPRFRAIPESVCQRIAQAAQRAGVIEGDEIREENEDEARRKILAALDK